MKPLYPVLLLMAFSFNAAAQSTKEQEKAAKKAAYSLKRAQARVRDSIALLPHSQGRMSAKLNLFNLFDPEAPTIQPGIEWRFSKRLSGEFGVGIPTRIHGNVRNTDSTYNRYYKLKLELRYFPLERRSFYLAPELTYISKERSKYNGTFIAKDGDVYRYDFAETDKSIFAFVIKAGLVAPLRKNHRWFFDAFFGAGPRFINFKVKALNMEPGFRGWFELVPDHEGTSTRVHISAAVKVGYVIF